MIYHLHISPLAASTVEIYANEDWTEDDPHIEAVCAAWRGARGRALLVTSATLDDVLSGLTILANTEDENCEGPGRLPDAHMRRFARAARDGLSAASTRLIRAFAEGPRARR